jgi:hypothetical protein
LRVSESAAEILSEVAVATESKVPQFEVVRRREVREWLKGSASKAAIHHTAD